MGTGAIIGLVFIGGGLGSLSRFGVGELALKFYDGKFPMGTLIANTLACTVLGIVLLLYRDKLADTEWMRYLIIIGFCGGFSTFSTFSAETLKLFQDGAFLFGILNILVSLLLGVGVLMILVKS